MLGACKTSFNESSFWQFLKLFKVGNPLTWFYRGYLFLFSTGETMLSNSYFNSQN
jgi:hypothetical protein